MRLSLRSPTGTKAKYSGVARATLRKVGPIPVLILLVVLQVGTANAQSKDKAKLDEVETAIAKTWGEISGLTFRFKEVKTTDPNVPYSLLSEGTRMVMRDGSGAKSRSEAVDYAVVMVGGKEEHKEIKRTLSICDGVHRIRHIAGQPTAERNKADDCDDPLRRFQWLRSQYELVVEPDEKLDGQLVWVLGARARGLPMNEWLLYFRKDGMLLKQMALEPKGSVKSTILYTDYKLDAKPDPGQFTFTPPEGVSVKDAAPKKGNPGS